MMIEGSIKEVEKDDDQKVMEEDLANDNSLEAKIEREVKRCI